MLAAQHDDDDDHFDTKMHFKNDFKLVNTCNMNALRADISM